MLAAAVASHDGIVWRLRRRVLRGRNAAHLFVEVGLSGEICDGRVDATTEILKNHGGRCAATEPTWGISKGVLFGDALE